ncbi:MAG: tetratricopeptide repeat protein [Thermodesulfobacteriota bacterium]
MNGEVFQGELLFSQGRLEEARSCFQAALTEAPESTLALNDLAVTCLALGRPEEAERYFLEALALEPGFREARFNLADLYLDREQWPEAVALLEDDGQGGSEDLARLNRLAKAYAALGRKDKVASLIDGSRAMSLMKKLADSFWFIINYWELEKDLSLRARLEGAVSTVLSVLDGQGGPDLVLKLVAADPENGEPLVLEGLRQAFYYKNAETGAVRRLRTETNEGRPREVLRIGPHPDWEFFRPLLFNEIKYEGGCLGDFTHSKKILRRECRLSRYDIEATLAYFRETVGPCDCHVFKGSYAGGEGAEFYETPAS